MIQRAVTSVIGVALGIFATFGVPSRYLAAVVLLVIGLVIVSRSLLLVETASTARGSAR